MKPLYIFLVSLFLIGCTGEDTEDSTSAVPVAKQADFNIKLNGVTYLEAVDQNYVVARIGNTFRVDLNYNTFLSFKADGSFGIFETEYIFPGGRQAEFSSVIPFSDNYMDFYVVVDEQQRRVKGGFSGYVYGDPFDINSEEAFINGEFDMPYAVTQSAVRDYGVSAKLNGEPWEYANWQSAAFINPTTQKSEYFGSDPYKITIIYNRAITPGTYSFSASDPSTCIRLSKYDTNTHSYLDYQCSGSFDLNSVEDLLYSGTFQLNAVNPENPGEVIQVTDGHFKTLYTY